MSLEHFPVIYTVGHSTRSLVELLDLLGAVGVSELVDVRSVPRSRRHPHFGSDALARDLPARGIDYRHEPALGGFRRPTTNSPNSGWQHEAFRGYADHMGSEEFQAALGRLAHRGRARTSALMCAEANWPRPSTTVTLRCLAIAARPPVSLATTPAALGAALVLWLWRMMR